MRFFYIFKPQNAIENIIFSFRINRRTGTLDNHLSHSIRKKNVIKVKIGNDR